MLNNWNLSFAMEYARISSPRQQTSFTRTLTRRIMREQKTRINPACWFPISLSSIFVFLCGCSLYLCLMMRRVTSTSTLYEGIPSYIIGIHFMICGFLLAMCSQQSLRNSIFLHRFSCVVLVLALILCVGGVVMTLWLADQQASLTFCTYVESPSACTCTSSNTTHATTTWVSFNDMDSCGDMDLLFNYMVAASIVYACGSVLCFLSVISMCYLFKTELLQRQRMARTRALRGPSFSSIDWNVWMFGDGSLQRMFAELQGAWFPPTYEESQRHASSTRMRHDNSVNANETTHSEELNGAPLELCVDQPPPPYSNIEQTFASPLQGDCEISIIATEHCSWNELDKHVTILHIP